jgi:hypothetical protein
VCSFLLYSVMSILCLDGAIRFCSCMLDLMRQSLAARHCTSRPRNHGAYRAAARNSKLRTFSLLTLIFQTRRPSLLQPVRRCVRDNCCDNQNDERCRHMLRFRVSVAPECPLGRGRVHASNGALPLDPDAADRYALAWAVFLLPDASRIFCCLSVSPFSFTRGSTFVCLLCCMCCHMHMR